mmetsp:Transcript_13282/g.19866  ORF Transcript_13282/g.19866 Transcript_13282/m.19866 type:complete len:192 (+) Transcript_13282:62-637(+)
MIQLLRRPPKREGNDSFIKVVITTMAISSLVFLAFSNAEPQLGTEPPEPILMPADGNIPYWYLQYVMMNFYLPSWQPEYLRMIRNADVSMGSKYPQRNSATFEAPQNVKEPSWQRLAREHENSVPEEDEMKKKRPKPRKDSKDSPGVFRFPSRHEIDAALNFQELKDPVMDKNKKEEAATQQTSVMEHDSK